MSVHGQYKHNFFPPQMLLIHSCLNLWMWNQQIQRAKCVRARVRAHARVYLLLVLFLWWILTNTLIIILLFLAVMSNAYLFYWENFQGEKSEMIPKRRQNFRILAIIWCYSFLNTQILSSHLQGLKSQFGDEQPPPPGAIQRWLWQQTGGWGQLNWNIFQTQGSKVKPGWL